VVWISNCDVTSIGIWCHHLYTIWWSTYTILDKIKPLWKRIGELPEIQIGCYRGDPDQQRHPGSSSDLFWLNKTVRRLRYWNFHLFSSCLALLLPCDVSYVTINEKFLMITSPLLSNVRHKAMITPVSLLPAKAVEPVFKFPAPGI